MKSTTRGEGGFYKAGEALKHPDNYSTSISSAFKATPYNNRYVHKNRKITSAKSSVPVSLSSPQQGLISRPPDSPTHQNVSLSAITVSDKFVSYI